MQRKTAQREAIRNVFSTLSRPLRVDEVLTLARATVESLNLATVYRNLGALVDEGWLRRFDHPGLGALYERAGLGHHHHFHCRVCDRLWDVPGECGFDDRVRAPSGFRSEGHEIFLYGTCNECSATP